MALSPPRAGLSRSSLEQLNHYATNTLSCPPELARKGGVHLVAAPGRARPAWNGYVLPMVALRFSTGAVIGVRPEAAGRLREEMGSDVQLPRLDDAALRRLRRAASRVFPHAFTLAGYLRAADAATFRPRYGAAVERIARDDPAALHLRHRFDGEVFGVRGPSGRLVSWAALKLKAPEAWEVAVTTEPGFRGRGYARDVVSAATAYALEQGRLCLYVHDFDNTASGFVARSLGYPVYAEVVLAEY